jgi:hypothetical protein
MVVTNKMNRQFIASVMANESVHPVTANGRQIDWSSPVAREFQLQSIPHLVIYNKDGEMDSEGDEARSKVIAWIKE